VQKVELVTRYEGDFFVLWMVCRLWLNSTKIAPIVNNRILTGLLIVLQASENIARRLPCAEAQLEYLPRLQAHDEGLNESGVILIDLYEIIHILATVNRHISDPHVLCASVEA